MRAIVAVLAGAGLGYWGRRESDIRRRRREAEAGTCCAGTGYADYAAVPCPNPYCPEIR